VKKRNLKLPHAVEELTSRKSAIEIPEVLERMKFKFPFGQKALNPLILEGLAEVFEVGGHEVVRPAAGQNRGCNSS
jgi:hypothetical protein